MQDAGYKISEVKPMFGEDDLTVPFTLMRLPEALLGSGQHPPCENPSCI